MSRDDEFNDDEFNSEEFIALLGAGDDGAWDMVCVRMRRPIFAYILHRLGEEAKNKQAAEDIFQDVFLSFRKSFQEGWRSISSDELIARARDIALGLHHLGVRRGRPVVLFGENSPEWTLTDAGTHLLSRTEKVL